MFLINYRPLLMVPMKLVRCFSTAFNNKAQNHYDALGLTPKATQGDIKSAYYKLSMQYHPDKNKGSEEAAQIFRDITEAYEVLGNLKLRKLYDKGILHTAGPQFAQQEEDMEMEDDSQSKFYKSRSQRSRAPPPTGKSPIYNFDEWTQAHYGKAFARREAAKQRYERKVEKYSTDKQHMANEVIFLSTVGILTMLAFSYIKHVSYDIVDESTNSEDSEVPVTNSIPQKV